jgi:UDP-N-acetylglucosamine acyltransferase
MSIHPSAVIHPSVRIGKNVEIGPYTVIDEDVVIGEDTKIDAYVRIGKHTTIGAKCMIYCNAVIAGPPQDHCYDPAVKSFTEIGAGTVIREFVTIHRSPKEGFKTVVGSKCMLMAFVHIAHDVCVGDRVVLVNHSGLSGHVQVESGATISGYNLFHQFCRVGTLAMVGPSNRINLDIPPYCLFGYPGYIYGPNTIGLRRAGMNAEQRSAIRKAIKTVFFRNLLKNEAIEMIESEPMTAEVRHFVDFIKLSKRGIVPTSPKHLESELDGE